jgi:hypothetical protein
MMKNRDNCLKQMKNDLNPHFNEVNHILDWKCAYKEKYCYYTEVNPYYYYEALSYEVIITF